MIKLKFLKLTLLLLSFMGMSMLALLGLLPRLALAAGPDSEGDLQLSPTGASFPEFAANSSYMVIVYQQSSQVYLRAHSSLGWWSGPQLIDTGLTPKAAFKPGATDKVHLVWASPSGDAIYHQLFTLNDTGPGVAGTINTVHSGVGLGLTVPDIAVDSSGRVHVAWSTGAGGIQTRVSTNDGASWSNLGTGLPSLILANQPVLAVSNSYVHLAFVNNNNTTLEYVRSAVGTSPHSWESNDQKTLPISNLYLDIRSPAIAATSEGNVLVAWDSNRSNIANNDVYGLISDLSTDNGVTWLSQPKHITATNDYDLPSGGAGNDRLSKPRNTSPQFEAGLRPSLALTGTSSFIVAWQQRPDAACAAEGLTMAADQNGTSEIFYAFPSSNWASTGLLGSDSSTYAIDPEVIVDSASVRHLVFLKATGVNCVAGGGSNGYAVYYRGPAQTIQPPKVYIPILLK